MSALNSRVYSKFKRIRVERILLFALLFLYSIRFLNKNCTWLLLFCAISFFLTMDRSRNARITAPVELASLVCFGVVYYILDIVNFHISMNLTTAVTLCFGAPLMYLSAKRLLLHSKKAERDLMRLVWVMSSGMMLWPFMSFLKYGVVTDYSPGMDTRLIADYWTGVADQVTNHNGYCVPVLVLSFCSVIFATSIIEKLLAFTPFCLVLFFSLATASRTNLMLALVLALSLAVVLPVVRRGYAPMMGKRTVRRICICVLLAALVLPLIALFSSQILSLLPIDAFRERSASRTLSLKNDSRWVFWEEVIREIPSHPFGGIRSVEAAHNLLLDIARVAGIFPMFSMLAFLSSVLFASMELISRKSLSARVRVTIFLLIFILMISFMIEPTLSAKPFVFIGFCFICGLQRGMLENEYCEAGPYDAN